jgi:hypothetical protein
MDPHATWRDMQNALKDEDWDLAIELAEALLAWLKGGGFPPVIGDKDLPYGWHRQLAEAGTRFVIIAAGFEQIDEEAEREEHAPRDQEAQP